MKLYKYFPKERVDFLHHRLVRLTPPAAFNDPFDMLPVVDSVFSRNRGAKTAKPFLGATLQQLHSLGERMADNLFNRTALLQRYLSEKYGVFCLSERHDSLLMWAHYASDHKGFVVEFDSAHPWFNQAESVPGDAGVGIVRKVAYRDERPTVSLRHNAIGLYFVKGSEWAYESEWRVVMLLDRATKALPSVPHSIQLFEIPTTAISSIILGARISVDHRKTLLQLLKRPQLAHVRCMQAALSPRRFDLDFAPLPEQQTHRKARRTHKGKRTKTR